MIDGRPVARANRRSCSSKPRGSYGTNNEELMDREQFGYFRSRCEKRRYVLERTISGKFGTSPATPIAPRASSSAEAERRLLAVRYNETENNVALWEPTTAAPQHEVQSREKVRRSAAGSS
jgi:hypothetical protein